MSGWPDLYPPSYTDPMTYHDIRCDWDIPGSPGCICRELRMDDMRPKDAHEALYRAAQDGELTVSAAYEAVKPFVVKRTEWPQAAGAIALLAFFAFALWLAFG